MAAAFCAAVSAYFAYEFRFATAMTGTLAPVLTTDQILAVLTITVGLVGLIVAVAAIGIGIAAVFGYAEIRQIATRQAEILLKKIIDKLRKRGDLTSGEASLLRQCIEDEELTENEASTAGEASNTGTLGPSATDTGIVEGAGRYPVAKGAPNESDPPIPGSS
jgi:hypothetical protein